MEAATPRGSSVGWLGCRRTERRPGRPIVLRKRVTTRHFAATAIRSCRRISLLTAAAISGVRPGRSAASVSRFGGEQEFAELTHGERSYRRESDCVVAVDDQSGDLVGFIWNDRFGEDRRQRHVGQRHLCRDAFGSRGRREASQRIARTERRRARQQRAQVIEDVACTGERVGVGHIGLRPAY